MIEIKTVNGRRIAYSTENQSGGGITHYITESYPTNFHTFATEVMLIGRETTESFKEVTAKEREALEAADALWERPSDELIAQWRSAAWGISPNSGGTAYAVKYEQCGDYNEQTGFFELYSVKDITEAQARLILVAGRPMDCYAGDGIESQWRYARFPNAHEGVKFRANLPALSPVNYTGNSMFWNAGFIDEICLPCVTLGYYSMYCLQVTTLTVYSINSAASFNGNNIVNLNLKIAEGQMARFDMTLPSSQLMTTTSWECLLKALQSSETEMSIKVPDVVFRALTGEGSYPLNGGEREQWEALAAMAEEKHVRFASV